MTYRILSPVFSLVLILLLNAWSEAGPRRAKCNPSIDCETVMVERTVMVPTYVKEKRTVQCTVPRSEIRTKTMTVYKCVPRQIEKTQTCTVMVPKTEMKKVSRVVCKPVYETKTRTCVVNVPQWKEVEQTFTVRVPVWMEQQCESTVMVSSFEKRQGTRTVSKCVPVIEKRSVRCDQGHWETQQIEVRCSKPCRCGSCTVCKNPITRTVCKRVWVPNVVESEIDVTVYRQIVEEVPYEYCVRVCKPQTITRTIKVCSYREEQRTCTKRVCSFKPETRTQEYKVCRYVKETQICEVPCTTFVPQQQTRKCFVTVYDQVPETRQVTYKVCVPEVVEKEIEVTVCRMVPKTIQVPVPSLLQVMVRNDLQDRPFDLLPPYAGSIRWAGITLLALVCFLNSVCCLADPGSQDRSQGQSSEQRVLDWHCDYAKARGIAIARSRLLLVYFRGPTQEATRTSFEDVTLIDKAIQTRLGQYVLLRLPVDAIIQTAQGPVRLLDHESFREMNGRPGLAVVDFRGIDQPQHHRVIGCLPFEEKAYYAQPYHSSQSVNVFLSLPPGTLTQRMMIYAVRMHPESPASTSGTVHSDLLAACESHSRHQAKIRLQGHHNWSARAKIIHLRVRGEMPTEVCAESWPKSTLLTACLDCVHSWRQSSGHWNAVPPSNPLSATTSSAEAMEFGTPRASSVDSRKDRFLSEMFHWKIKWAFVLHGSVLHHGRFCIARTRIPKARIKDVNPLQMASARSIDILASTA